jgi:alpha-N-arabinofuranosidase
MMQRTDSTISLIAAGSSNFREGSDPMHWNRTILQGLGEVMDYIALHMYVGNPDDNYYNFMSTPLVMEDRTEIVRAMINEVTSELPEDPARPPIYIAWDEYNVWYRARRGEDARGREALEEHYNLEDALVIAGFLNTFVRNADIVKMANMAQLTNVIAPIFTNEGGMFKQTIFFPLALFANNVLGTSLDAFVESGTYDTEEFFVGLSEQTTRQTDVPYLDVSATLQDDGTVIVNVVNRHLDQAMATDIIAQEGSFEGPFEVHEVNGPDIKTVNNFGEEPVTTTRHDDLDVDGDQFTYSFPPHSFTMLKGRLVR